MVLCGVGLENAPDTIQDEATRSAKRKLRERIEYVIADIEEGGYHEIRR